MKQTVHPGFGMFTVISNLLQVLECHIKYLTIPSQFYLKSRGILKRWHSFKSVPQSAVIFWQESHSQTCDLQRTYTKKVNPATQRYRSHLVTRLTRWFSIHTFMLYQYLLLMSLSQNKGI